MRDLPPPARAAWAYFLDVDGTLIDIAATPEAAHMDAALLMLIERLHAATGGAVALISGRSIADLVERLGPLRLPIAGQHGLERQDAEGRRTIRSPRFAAAAAAKEALAPVLARHPGLRLEDKGLTLALHYRQAPHLGAYVRRLMHRLAGPGLEVQLGKCVAELKPAGIDKGSALAGYLEEPPFRGRLPVFIGDDRNDEHGFAEINRRGGISVKVGPGASCARYRLHGVAAVRQWLAGALDAGMS